MKNTLKNIAHIFGFEKLTTDVQEYGNLQNLSIGMPVAVLTLLTAISQVVIRVLNHQALLSLTHYYILFITSVLLIVTAFYQHKNKEEQLPRTNLIVYLYVLGFMNYEMSKIIEYYSVGRNPLGFWLMTVAIILLLTLRPIAVFIITSIVFIPLGLEVTLHNMSGIDVRLMWIVFYIILFMAVIHYWQSINTIKLSIKVRNEEEKQRRLNGELEKVNEQLSDFSKTDTLTGINNRFALRQAFDDYKNKDLCVMLSDIDDFKGINDTYGHGMGDRVLEQYSSLMKITFRDTDFYRYGGDEFLIVSRLPQKEFQQQLESFIYAFASLDYLDNHAMHTASCGYVYGNSGEDNLRSMIAEADEMLYKAKKNGKNREMHKEFVEGK